MPPPRRSRSLLVAPRDAPRGWTRSSRSPSRWRPSAPPRDLVIAAVVATAEVGAATATLAECRAALSAAASPCGPPRSPRRRRVPTSCGSPRARTSTCCSSDAAARRRSTARPARSSSERRATWRCSSRPAARRAPGPVSCRSAPRWHDWAALELGAWVARATGAPLRLIGAAVGRRRGRPRRQPPARRRLADRPARAGVVAEPLLASPGRSGVIALAEGAGLLVVGPLGALARGGPRPRARASSPRRRPRRPCSCAAGRAPGGLAPPRRATRFGWSLTAGRA